MIDALKIIDMFDYNGIQGFLHTDFSVSSIIELPEFSNLDLMNDFEMRNYELKKDSFFNSLRNFGNGMSVPPVKSTGGTIYQLLTTSKKNIEEELEIIKHSNKSKALFSSLLDKIVEEERVKIVNKSQFLNKPKNYLVMRTYLSKKEMKKLVFEYKNKKYNNKNFHLLYTDFLLENNKESEDLKELFFKFLEPLFVSQLTTLKNFDIRKLTETRGFNLQLSENLLEYRLLDILGQVNIIRDFYGMSDLSSLDQNKNILTQLFDKEIICGSEYTKINTEEFQYLIYNKYDELMFTIYQDDSGNVILKNVRENKVDFFQKSIIFKHDGEYFDNKTGYIIISRDLKNTLEEQVSKRFFEEDGFKIVVEPLYKYIQVFGINKLPDTINKRTGENLFEELQKKLADKSIKFNITTNFHKMPKEEWKAKFMKMKMGWKIISTIPSMKDFLYDSVSVYEKMEAIEAAEELLRKDLVKFVESQIFITIVSYGYVDFESDVLNVLQSSEFEFGSTIEDGVSSAILFNSASPMGYSIETLKMEKELLLTDSDFRNLVTFNNGPSRFSLEEPTLIGISNERKVNFINTFDSRIEAPNGIVIGSTGSGKSFTKTYELIKLLTLGEEPFISIIDRGGSFINFVEIFGGKAIRLNLKDPKNNINPFVYNNDFKNSIRILEKQNQGYKNIEIKKVYKSVAGDNIYEDSDGDLLYKDNNNEYQPYLDTDISPQTKLGFFTSIVQSMTKNKKAEFKSVITNLLKKIITINEDTFGTTIQLNNGYLLIVKDTFIEEVSNKKTLSENIVFNPEEIIIEENKDFVKTNKYKFIETEEGVLVEYNEVIGKSFLLENTKILKIKKATEITKKTYYFTAENIKLKLLEIGDRYEDDSRVLDSYIDYNVYGNLFNGPPVLNFDNELLWTIDMGEETPDDLSNVILQALNIILWSSILSPKNKSRKKMIVFDEVHHILSNVEDTGSAAAIAYMYRTIRKHGGGIHILSQSSADILKTQHEVTPEQQPIFAGIKANAMYKYIIGINSDDAKRAQEDFQLTDIEIAGIIDFSETKTKIASKRGLIYVKTKAFKGFINIEATPTVYAIATTKKEEKNLMEAIAKELILNEDVNEFMLEHSLTESQKKNVYTIIKITIFATLFPKGINNIYGENSESVFMNKHISNQKEGTDKFFNGLRDYILTNDKGLLVDNLVKNELNKVKKLL